MAPLFVKLNDHIEGRTSLRTLGVRVLTVMEFALRPSLPNAHAKLPGLHPENTTKMALQPQLASCHAGHDGDHLKYRIIPSKVGRRMRDNDFMRHSLA
jgi:hypothetical protein